MNAPLFPMGRLVATSNALANIPNPEILTALGRHATGDWGEVDVQVSVLTFDSIGVQDRASLRLSF